VRKQTYKL